MIFMDIITWDPKDNEEVIKKYVEWEWPEGVTVINEWTDLSACRYVAVVDVEDSKSFAAAAAPWKGLCQIETFPVMETGKFMQMMSEYV
ncbi:DUF3303 domain-containing protein [Methanohalophilus halophilus]|uniref:DUF3303 domain-containing protein n=1 Tax=Methanohalophilus halophilus TaxID=2177 RepID=A0A1L3PZN2_9EURY|nr:DUF3303 family protein [Methanohalophilus halophilus]APH38084.1 hypothetical protein BHR79_00375 [Methanohalophilus halophilus]RNI11052.1 DUF3303 domain-containing protein [Methanohalophilus halophilus]SDW83656.1 Protein of unknown function [Methanohalophilus halophilus]